LKPAWVTSLCSPWRRGPSTSEREQSTTTIASEGRKQPKKVNQAWGSNPESRPIAYCIGKSRLTIGPTRLIVVQVLTFTPSRPSSLDHPHKGAKTKGGRPAYHWANPADCCSGPHIHTKSAKLPRPPSQRCQNLARLRHALFLFSLAFTTLFACWRGGGAAGSSWSRSSSSSVPDRLRLPHLPVAVGRENLRRNA
jgi:hypothetical protein